MLGLRTGGLTQILQVWQLQPDAEASGLVREWRLRRAGLQMQPSAILWASASLGINLGL